MGKNALLTWLIVHFLLLIAVSFRETLLLVSQGVTVLPSGVRSYSAKAESVAAALLSLHFTESNPLRQTVATYLSFAGIDAGYGYFAPNVPNSYKLVFELHYRDGHVETRTPTEHGGAIGLRLVSLLDEIGRTQSGAFREYMIKKLAALIWREQPDVVTMRALLSQFVEPTPDDYQQGKRKSEALLYAYDFSLASGTAAQEQ